MFTTQGLSIYFIVVYAKHLLLDWKLGLVTFVINIPVPGHQTALYSGNSLENESDEDNRLAWERMRLLGLSVSHVIH